MPNQAVSKTAVLRTNDGTEFAMLDCDTCELITEAQYGRRDPAFPVLPAVGDFIEWSGHSYRVKVRAFNPQNGAWPCLLYVEPDHSHAEEIGKKRFGHWSSEESTRADK